MFRFLLSHPQALLRYRSLTTTFKMHCGIPNVYNFYKSLLCINIVSIWDPAMHFKRCC